MIKKFIISVITSAILINFSCLATSPLSKEKLLEDIDIIKDLFEHNYAPADWKQERFSWDLNLEAELAKQKILQSPEISLKKYWSIVKKLLLSTKDYHVGIRFCSTEMASLPFEVRSAEGHYYFAYVDHDSLAPEFPFHAGDELISIDGTPIEKMIEGLKNNYLGDNTKETDQMLAERYLTFRSGSSGFEVPYGKVNIKGVVKNTANEISYQMYWDYIAEEMQFYDTKKNSQEKVLNRLFDVQSISHEYANTALKETLSKSTSQKGNTELPGSRKSSIPYLGKVIWESDEKSPFFAYSFQLEDGQSCGYIRIPTFNPTRHTINEGLEDFSKTIELFENTVDMLVIDQLNNPGGDVAYTYLLASMLIDKPLKTTQDKILLDQDSIFRAIQFKKFSDGFSSSFFHLLNDFSNGRFAPAICTYHSLFDYYNQIVDQWKLGLHFTEPLHDMGIEWINPSPVTQFKKPILILINPLDFSCADLFPALLQDNDRAFTFGSRTAGAGGAVNSFSFPNSHGIHSISYTSTVGIRADGSYMENNGTSPDFPYQVSAFDLQNNYADYVKNVNQTLNTILKDAK